MSRTLPTWVGGPWLQQGLDSLKATLDLSVSQKREMIQFLFDAGFWDEEKLGWASAQTKFANCMTPGRSGVHFKLAEIWALMKRFQRHELLYAMCDDLGFERPRLIPTEERKQQLLERIALALESRNLEVDLALGELIAAGGAPAPSRVHPGIQEGGLFSQPDDNTGSLEAF